MSPIGSPLYYHKAGKPEAKTRRASAATCAGPTRVRSLPCVTLNYMGMLYRVLIQQSTPPSSISKRLKPENAGRERMRGRYSRVNVGGLER